MTGDGVRPERGLCLPGFLDGHIHIESSMTSPGIERAVVPHGTTAVITDPHEIAMWQEKRGSGL